MSYVNTEKYSYELRKHKEFLSKFKVFPTKTRKVIYLSLMALPLNHNHFLELTKPFKELPEHTTNRQTAFIVNALTKLYPSLGVQWLPGIIYPFVKLFEEDSIMCFESSLTFLMNWYQPVFENYPNPSKRVIDFARKYLPNLDKKVLASNYTLGAILNPMILVCLTDVLNKEDSLQVLDFLISNPYSPEYFICVAVAIVAMFEEQLCKMKSVEEISIALRKEKKLNVEQLIENAVQMAKSNQKELQALYSKKSFPLTKERYPVFEFIKTQVQRSNDSIDKLRYDQMNTLGAKYNELSKMINTRLKEGMVANSYEIDNRYQEVEAQTIQYLNKMKREHQMKLKALKEIEEKFKEQIIHEEQQSRTVMNQRNLNVIERRGRLEREVLKLEQEAKKIRELEEDLVNRINSIAEIRKDEIRQSNRRLEEEQKSEELYKFYEP